MTSATCTISGCPVKPAQRSRTLPLIINRSACRVIILYQQAIAVSILCCCWLWENRPRLSVTGRGAIARLEDELLETTGAHRMENLRSMEEVRAVHSAAVRLQHTLDPEELAAETIRVLEQNLGYEFGAVMLIDGSSDRLTPFALSDQNKGPDFVVRDREEILSYDVRLNHGITGWVAANGETVRCGDVREDPRYLGIRSGVMSELCVPMWVRDRVIGVVNVETSEADAYSDSDQRVLEIIASQIAVAIENSKLHTALVHSQRLDAVGRLTSGIAHDFNNLLTVITGNAEMLLDRNDLDHAARDAIEQISLAASRSSTMTQQLLAFSRKSVLRTEVVDPNAAIMNLETMLRRLLGDRISLSIQTEPVGLIEVDRTHFDQVMVNLAVNARDAMPEGGNLRIATSRLTVPGETSFGHPELAPGQYVTISVTDTGQGMDEVTRQSLFEPFFSTREGGTGLGLAMVHGVIRQSGGDVSVESRPGHGARFSIYLPETETAENEKAPAPVSGAESTTRVLVVDDDECVRELVTALLQGLGYQVIAAASGTEALEAAVGPGGPVDVVVSDVVMPGMSGPALVRALRERCPAIRVLYMSAYPISNTDQTGAFTESDHLLTKPFTRNELRETMLRVTA